MAASCLHVSCTTVANIHNHATHLKSMNYGSRRNYANASLSHPETRRSPDSRIGNHFICCAVGLFPRKPPLISLLFSGVMRGRAVHRNHRVHAIDGRDLFTACSVSYTCVTTFMELYFPSWPVEWDAAKARSNARKHGVRFEDAILVFDDPCALAEQDRFEGGEPRWQTLGLAGGNPPSPGGPCRPE